MWKKNVIKSGWGRSHKRCLKESGKLKSLNRISFRLFIYLFELPRRKFPAATNGTCEEEPSEKVGTWDFVESSQRSYCSCSRSVDVQHTQVLLIRARSKTFQRGYVESTGLWTAAQSQQNICKLHLRLDFDKHIILHIFQFITILCKRQPWRRWNLCWLVCFCKSDVFIPALTGGISGGKSSLTSDVAVEGGKRNECC